MIGKSYKLTFFMLINVALFFFIILWLKRHVEIPALEKNIHNVVPFSICTTLFLSFLLLVVYGFRLSCILQIEFSTSFGIACLGHGLNNIFPFRLGEAFKIILAQKIYVIPVVNMLIASFIEKFLDLLIIFLIGSILLYSKAVVIKTNFFHTGFTLFIFFSCAIMCFCVAAKKFRWNIKCFNKIKIFGEARDFFKQIFNNKKKHEIIFSSMVIWGITFFIFYSFFSLNLSSLEFHFSDAVTLLFLTTVSLALPSAPASLGVFEAAVVYGLIRCHGLDENVAVGLAIVFHFLVTLPQIILMGVILIIERKAAFSNRNLLLSQVK